MPPEEFKQVVRVDKDHRVIMSVPELEEGTVVDVTIHAPRAAQGNRVPGSAKGLLKILPGFDDPIPGFEEYR